MKMKSGWVVLAVLLFGGLTQTALAFTSGSTGADGAFNPTTNTVVQLPESGVLNWTTVNIPSGVTVTFKKNTSNTPVYMLATNDVTIAGAINLNGSDAQALTPGKGGPGGFDGGIGAPPNSCGGAGLGPGGGKAAVQVASSMTNGSGGGGGSYGTTGTNGTLGNATYSTAGAAGNTYGNSVIVSFVGGSGGGGGCGTTGQVTTAGGGGGGAILIASSGTINVTGAISANGGNGAAVVNFSSSGSGGGGSGGAIKLLATIVKGEGSFSVNGGAAGGAYYAQPGGSGGYGRIRFETTTLARYAGTTPAYSYSATPLSVFPSNNPVLKIASIGRYPVSDYPAGQYASPDVVLPPGSTNPVDIVLQASNIPVGTTVTITMAPQVGAVTSATTSLSGAFESSTASASVNLSTQYASVITAAATFTVQYAANEMPMYAGGEKVVKMRVASVLGRGSSVIYITESGREIPAGI